MRWLSGLLNRLSCRLGRCRMCRLLNTDEGIGGQCTTCGRVHGWVTRDELRRVLLATAKPGCGKEVP